MLKDISLKLPDITDPEDNIIFHNLRDQDGLGILQKFCASIRQTTINRENAIQLRDWLTAWLEGKE